MMMLTRKLTISANVNEHVVYPPMILTNQGNYELDRLRIFERVTPQDVLAQLPEADRSVIQDAILERSKQHRDAADKMLDGSGLLGNWRPSSVIVHRFVWSDMNIWLAESALAYALWDQEFRVPYDGRPIHVGRASSFELTLTNDEPVERELFVHLSFRPPGSFPTAARGRQIQDAIAVRRKAETIAKSIGQGADRELTRKLAQYVADLADLVAKTAGARPS